MFEKLEPEEEVMEGLRLNKDFMAVESLFEETCAVVVVITLVLLGAGLEGLLRYSGVVVLVVVEEDPVGEG